MMVPVEVAPASRYCRPPALMTCRSGGAARTDIGVTAAGDHGVYGETACHHLLMAAQAGVGDCRVIDVLERPGSDHGVNRRATLRDVLGAAAFDRGAGRNPAALRRAAADSATGRRSCEQTGSRRPQPCQSRLRRHRYTESRRH